MVLLCFSPGSPTARRVEFQLGIERIKCHYLSSYEQDNSLTATGYLVEIDWVLQDRGVKCFDENCLKRG